MNKVTRFYTKCALLYFFTERVVNLLLELKCDIICAVVSLVLICVERKVLYCVFYWAIFFLLAFLRERRPNHHLPFVLPFKIVFHWEVTKRAMSMKPRSFGWLFSLSGPHRILQKREWACSDGARFHCRNIQEKKYSLFSWTGAPGVREQCWYSTFALQLQACLCGEIMRGIWFGSLMDRDDLGMRDIFIIHYRTHFWLFSLSCCECLYSNVPYQVFKNL